MSEPRIFTKNYVNGDDVFTVSHSSATRPYLYDRDKDSKWLSSGANSDATQISIQVDFYEGSNAISRTIDKLILINHNLKTWTFYYWNGSAWVSLASETTDAADTTYKSFSPVTTTKVKLEATATQSVNAEKFIGEMVVCALQMDIGHDLSGYDPRYRERTRESVLGDGSIHRMVTQWTQNRCQKYECRATVQFLSEAERLTLKGICEARQPFLWYPEADARPDEIFLVRWSAPWAEKYVSTYKGAGSEVVMDLKEI